MNRPRIRPQRREWCPRRFIREHGDLVQPCARHARPCHDCVVVQMRQERLKHALWEVMR